MSTMSLVSYDEGETTKNVLKENNIPTLSLKIVSGNSAVTYDETLLISNIYENEAIYFMSYETIFVDGWMTSTNLGSVNEGLFNKLDFVLYGNMPKNDDEIMLSKYILFAEKYLDSSTYNDANYIMELIKSGYYYNEYKIVGIFDTNISLTTNIKSASNLDLACFISKKSYDKLYKNEQAYAEIIDILNQDNLTNKLNNLNQTLKKNYSYNHPFSQEIESLSSFVAFYKDLFVIIGSILLFASAINFIAYIYFIIDSQRDLIRILRSIGTSSFDISVSFIIEATLKSLVSYIISLIIYFIVTFAFNNYLINTYLLSFSPLPYSYALSLIVLAIFILITILSTYIIEKIVLNKKMIKDI